MRDYVDTLNFRRRKTRAADILRHQEVRGFRALDSEMVDIKLAMSNVQPNFTMDQVADMFCRAEKTMGSWDVPEANHRHKKKEWRLKTQLQRVYDLRSFSLITK